MQEKQTAKPIIATSLNRRSHEVVCIFNLVKSSTHPEPSQGFFFSSLAFILVYILGQPQAENKKKLLLKIWTFMHKHISSWNTAQSHFQHVFRKQKKLNQINDLEMVIMAKNDLDHSWLWWHNVKSSINTRQDVWVINTCLNMIPVGWHVSFENLQTHPLTLYKINKQETNIYCLKNIKNSLLACGKFPWITIHFYSQTCSLKLQERQTEGHRLSQSLPDSLGLNRSDLNWRKNKWKRMLRCADTKVMIDFGTCASCV